MSGCIEEEQPDNARVKQLISELDEILQVYPKESRHGYSTEKLVNEKVHFFTKINKIGDEEEAEGCVGVKIVHDSDEKYAELKRLYVRPKYRGTGNAKKLIKHVIDFLHTNYESIHLLRLETGVYQKDAILLYERMGFRVIPSFGEYTPDVLSLCYQLII